LSFPHPAHKSTQNPKVVFLIGLLLALRSARTQLFAFDARNVPNARSSDAVTGSDACKAGARARVPRIDDAPLLRRNIAARATIGPTRELSIDSHR
jgi:hypothetical protein